MSGLLIAQAGGFTITWPTIDWTALAKEIVPDFFNAIADWSSGVEQSVWQSMWGSDVNVFGHTDPNLVLGGPIATYAQQAQAAALGIVVFAIVVLGLRAALSSFVPMSNQVAGELVEGVAGALILAGAFVLLAPRLLGWLNDALHEIGDVDFSQMFRAGSVGPNPIVFALLALLVLFFAGRLIIRVLYRVALLAIMYPVGIVALLLRAVPQLRWVSGWWARLWFGWLVAQVPSAMALVIGVQLFAFGDGSVVAALATIALLQLAYDVYDIFAWGFSARGGGIPLASFGPRLPGLLGGNGAMRAATGAVRGASSAGGNGGGPGRTYFY